MLSHFQILSIVKPSNFLPFVYKWVRKCARNFCNGEQVIWTELYFKIFHFKKGGGTKTKTRYSTIKLSADCMKCMNVEINK